MHFFGIGVSSPLVLRNAKRAKLAMRHGWAQPENAAMFSTSQKSKVSLSQKANFSVFEQKFKKFHVPQAVSFLCFVKNNARFAKSYFYDFSGKRGKLIFRSQTFYFSTCGQKFKHRKTSTFVQAWQFYQDQERPSLASSLNALIKVQDIEPQATQYKPVFCTKPLRLEILTQVK